MKELRFLGIIPARYGSSRFPGKPLADFWGKPMIERVYEGAKGSFGEDLWVATDDERIAEAVRGFGGKVVMTSSSHRSGTERCGEALEQIERECGSYDVVVNVQGDEPFVAREHLESLKRIFEEESTQIATLVKVVDRGDEGTRDLFNQNVPKVVLTMGGEALYFSRIAIPSIRGVTSGWPSLHEYYKHIGLYGYRSGTLRELVRLPMGKLERAESLEQLRWLEYGYKIRACITEIDSYGIDTEEDYKRALSHKEGIRRRGL
jgi:3-deoxy-manno-octulosonate cytidylyltransferase (CMP-KDO synthetase)